MQGGKGEIHVAPWDRRGHSPTLQEVWIGFFFLSMHVKPMAFLCVSNDSLGQAGRRCRPASPSKKTREVGPPLIDPFAPGLNGNECNATGPPCNFPGLSCVHDPDLGGKRCLCAADELIGQACDKESTCIGNALSQLPFVYPGIIAARANDKVAPTPAGSALSCFNNCQGYSANFHQTEPTGAGDCFCYSYDQKAQWAETDPAWTAALSAPEDFPTVLRPKPVPSQ